MGLLSDENRETLVNNRKNNQEIVVDYRNQIGKFIQTIGSNSETLYTEPKYQAHVLFFVRTQFT